MNLHRYVYVIMPVDSDPLFLAKRCALELGIGKSGRRAKFPLPVLDRPPFELANFIRDVREAELVIADVSHERPSCYYELGVVEALGKPVHVIALEDTPIHQCASRSTVRFFRDMADLTRTTEAIMRVGATSPI